MSLTAAGALLPVGLAPSLLVCLLLLAFTPLAAASAYVPPYPTPAGAKNVLFLAVDDMRPSLGAYNFTLPGQPSHSPNIDRLAAGGTVFTRAYVQYAYCSPSRNSFMSGRRPDTTKVWEFADHFREVGVGASWVTMPEYFKQFGYLTLGGGKLFHPASKTENIGMDSNDWPASWSPDHPYFLPKDDPQAHTCASQGPFPLPPGSPPHPKFAWCALDVDKDDSVMYGQKVRDNCVANLEFAANYSARKQLKHDDNSTDANRRPFFIGCGFHKPHAPHYAPKEFFDQLPDWPEVPLPVNQFAPVGMPEVAWHPYADVSGMSETPAFNGTVNQTRLRIYRRAYYASIAYTDYNIGVILDKLDALRLASETVVVVLGDHGYQLGEHATWAKMTNFELGVHAPLILRAPWVTTSVGQETSVLAEFVDIYPTLVELAGLPDPRTLPGSQGINGTSLVPALVNPKNISIKSAAFSQFSKNNIGTNVQPIYFRNATKLMGYSIRTEEWRYTAWFRFNGTGARGPYPAGPGPDFFGRVMVEQSLGRELYDHRGDSGKYLDWSGENVNLVNYTEYTSVVEALHQRVLDYIQIK